MFERSIRSGLLLISFLLSITSFSQGLGNSPYSRSGVGDLSAYRGTVRNMGMGSAGVSVMSNEYMNLLNPAALANLRNHYRDSMVKIDVGYTIQYKTLKDPQTSTSTLGANINYLAFAFPANRTWTTAIVLTPLTVVQNSYGYKDTVPNDPNNYSVLTKYKGSGGVYQLQWGNGFGIGDKLSVGLTTNFNFGTINQEATTQLIIDPNNPDSQNENGLNRKTSYSGLSFKPGFLFSKELFKVTETIRTDSILIERRRLFYKDSSTFTRARTGLIFNVAGTVEFFANMKATETRTLFSRNSINNIIYDSSLTKDRAHAYFPTFYRAGISLERRGYWTFAADFMYTDWSGFSKNSLKNDTLKNTYSVYLGAEKIALWESASGKPKILVYRGGFTYSTLPFSVNGAIVHDFSGSFGMSIPVGRSVKDPNGKSNPFKPKLNTAIVIGQRSCASSDALRETYYRLQLSMVIYDKWFTRRKIQ